MKQVRVPIVVRIPGELSRRVRAATGASIRSAFKVTLRRWKRSVWTTIGDVRTSDH